MNQANRSCGYIGESLTDGDGTIRANVMPGLRVSIVMKADQASGKLTDGVVKDVLTPSAVHPHGIKVRLQGGQVGRVKEIAPGRGQTIQDH